MVLWSPIHGTTIRTTLAMISVSGRVRDLFISHSTVFTPFTAYYISVVLHFLLVPALVFKPANKEDVLVLSTTPSATEKHNREIGAVGRIYLSGCPAIYLSSLK